MIMCLLHFCVHKEVLCVYVVYRNTSPKCNETNPSRFNTPMCPVSPVNPGIYISCSYNQQRMLVGNWAALNCPVPSESTCSKSTQEITHTQSDKDMSHIHHCIPDLWFGSYSYTSCVLMYSLHLVVTNWVCHLFLFIFRYKGMVYGGLPCLCSGCPAPH